MMIPLGGLGSRFQKEGYTRPKPCVQVMGKPMILWVLDSLTFTWVFLERVSSSASYQVPYIFTETSLNRISKPPLSPKRLTRLY